MQNSRGEFNLIFFGRVRVEFENFPWRLMIYYERNFVTFFSRGPFGGCFYVMRMCARASECKTLRKSDFQAPKCILTLFRVEIEIEKFSFWIF